MAKTKNDKGLFGFNFWDTRTTIRECQNLVRWNPALALEWMTRLQGQPMNSLVTREYNRAVQVINNHLDQLERHSWYNKKEVWGVLAPQRLEEMYEPLDDMALHQFASKLNENLD
jgi:hypothetical protein